MSTHSEHSTPQPAATNGAHPRHLSPQESFDLITGEPPVPITVWRTTRHDDDTHATIPARLAARLIAAYSRPGETVIDLTDQHALTSACRTGGRRHHPAWFTEVSTLIVGPATPTPDSPADDLDLDDAVGAGHWFGDDLTDTLPPDTDPATTADSDNGGGGDAGLGRTVSLIVASWPLDAAGDAANRVRLAFLLTACRRLLRTGGCLVLVVSTPNGQPAVPQDFTGVVAAASGSGLGYLQHIVAVTADTDGDRFTYYATDEELLALTQPNTGEHFYLHMHVHADLLIFMAQPRTDRDGGDDRG